MKRTYQPNKKKRAKKHGFFARIKGKVLNSRRAKKRKKLNNTWQLLKHILKLEYKSIHMKKGGK